MRAALLALALGALSLPAEAGREGRTAEDARKYFTDTKLINQDGKVMRFYSDLLQGRSIVIDTFFTTCTGVCPLLNQRMARIQSWLGDRLGKDVVLVSISVDPEHDTPPRLLQYAQRFKARPGWYFLTGPKPNVDIVLRKLGHLVSGPDDHNTILLVGNDRTELWKKAQGVAASDDVIKVVQSVVDDR